MNVVHKRQDKVFRTLFKKKMNWVRKKFFRGAIKGERQSRERHLGLAKALKKNGKTARRPRGRPKLGDAAREGLIDAAVKMVEETGYEKLNARGLAAASGVGVGTIYKYFEDLPELMRYANGRTYDLLHDFQTEKVAESAASGGGVEDQLMALAIGYLEFIEAHRNRWMATLAFNSSQDEAPEWYREKERGLLEIVAGVMEPLPRLKDRAQRYRTAMALWASVHGIILTLLTGGFLTRGAEEAMKQARIIIEPVVREYS